MAVMHVGMKMRIACCSLIYRKALRISLGSLGGKTVGNVVNLMSNDVNRFDMTPLFFHYLWISPIQVVFILYFMYREMHMSALIGILAILGFIPMQAFLGHRTSVLRHKTAVRTDDRVRMMNEIIQGIQVIKMYTWEYAFSSLIYRARQNEINVLKHTSYIRGVIMSFIMFTTRFAIFLTVMSYVLMGNTITAENVFVITSYYQILRQTMTVYFPQGVAQVAEASVAISRIRKFLLTEETDVGDPTPIDPNWRIKPNRRKYKKERDMAPERLLLPRGIWVENAWARYGDDVCLDDITLDVVPGKLTVIIGQVGAGKSCLLNMVLGELHPFKGTMYVNGVISYAAQEPWLFAGSVRQNILFGQEYDRVRYRDVVRVCALTRDFSLLPYGDKTIVGERGISLSGGQRARVNLARAVYKVADIYLLDDPLSAVDTQVGKHLFDECINKYLKDKVVVLVTHQLQYLKHVEQIVILDEGKILVKGSYDYLQESGLNFAKLLEEQLAIDDASEENKVQNILNKISIHSAMSMDSSGLERRFTEPEEVAEMRTIGAVDWLIYKEYFHAGANWCVIAVLCIFFFGAQVFASGGDYFLSQWVKIEEHRTSHHHSTPVETYYSLSRKQCIIIYAILILTTVTVAVSRSFFFFTICMRASVNLHNKMFRSIIRASMRFFQTNTSGRILNRFSKDLGAIDEFLPNAMIDTFQIMLNLLGVVLVVSLISYYLLIPTIAVCILFYMLRRYYLYTSRSVKRLEGITRSPVFAHLNATLQGLTTIRSHGQEMILVDEFDKYQDVHSSAWFMFISTSRAFGYWLDCICVFFIAMVTLSFLVMEETSFGGEVGLAITQCIGLTGLFQWGMRQSAELENQMTSVERVLEFTRIEHEPELESKPDDKPPPDWPQEGEIEFRNAVMRYSTTEPPVLKNLTFVIQPKEKIGIVGRTGAGKSSLISALFRLAYFQGKVYIDGLDIARIGLHDLRRKISIIPQEPVIFSGTMRYNLDPFNEYNDETLLMALQVVEIKSALTDGIACLDQIMAEGGTNVSVGQRQLICLARAIIRNNAILVMDEATANVDPQTDRFIQNTIRTKFSQCTVLTIAHRLNTVMDSDRIMVMDAGNVVELDHPYILLKNKLGYLTTMVNRSGPSMAEHLRKVAQESYEKRYGTSA
ncbi:hypothetical protein ILUMI_25557 [Ignelater luminosus]|uniref:Multidrug resistance-associated protein lethal(2)03659 n=1 Tax=Ignelater luminosus TaxID=2038154 RepID=A0A8K0FXU3_IGNLU|nr:hypothetical protein ILUMI_25557 [Ignelater luminosus]